MQKTDVVRNSFWTLYDSGARLSFFPDSNIVEGGNHETATEIKLLVHDAALALRDGTVPMSPKDLAVKLHLLKPRLVYINYALALLQGFDKQYATELQASIEVYRTITITKAKLTEVRDQSRLQWTADHPDTRSAEALLESAFNNLLAAQELMSDSKNKRYAREKMSKSKAFMEEATVSNSNL